MFNLQNVTRLFYVKRDGEFSSQFTYVYFYETSRRLHTGWIFEAYDFFQVRLQPNAVSTSFENLHLSMGYLCTTRLHIYNNNGENMFYQKQNSVEIGTYFITDGKWYFSVNFTFSFLFV